MERSRNYCFTINNPTPATIESLQQLAAQVRYIIFQEERGANGTNHIQGYTQFHTPLSLNGAKRRIHERAHLEIARGSPEQNIQYCSKEETRIQGPYTYGTPITQGKRSDLSAFAISIKDGMTDINLLEQYTNQYFRFHRVIDRIRLMSRAKRTWEMAVKCIWGPSGFGKTRLANTEAGEDVFYLSKGDSTQSIWWDGYNGEQSIIIDDFYGWLPWTFILRLLDRYPFNVQFKGGSMPFTSKKIFITSNQEPRTWYKNVPNDDYTPLLRRINETIHVTEPINFDV